MKHVLLALSVLLLLDVAPCGGCGNNKPVERNPDKMEKEADERPSKPLKPEAATP